MVEKDPDSQSMSSAQDKKSKKDKEDIGTMKKKMAVLKKAF